MLSARTASSCLRLAIVIVGSACAAQTRASGTTEEAPASDAAPTLRLVTVGERVYAAIREDPLSLAVNSNSMIVVRDSDVVVVDAQFTRAATLETISALRSVTRKPVGYVINTHWHDDHLAGDQVYRDTFPQVRFVMQANTAEDLATLGADNRKNTVESAPPIADRFDRLLRAGLGIDSTPVSPAERGAVTSALRIMRRYLAEAPGFRAVAATDTVQRRLTLGSGKQRVDAIWYGRANTRGDLVVHVPEQGVVATGDLVVAPVPFAFNAYPAEWADVLDSVAALRPRVLVPGHGPVMRTFAYADTVRRMLRRVSEEAAAAVARGDSLSVALRTITLEEFRERMAADEKWRNYMFRSFFLRPSVSRAYEQATKR